MENPCPENFKQKAAKCMKENLLLLSTVLSVLIGIALGFVARLFEYTTYIVVIVSFPGELLMRMLKMLIVPLMVSSMISGFARLGGEASGKMRSRTHVYYLATTIFAAVVGIILVLTMHPGDPTIKEMSNIESEAREVSTFDALLDHIRNLFPENLLKASFQQSETVFKMKNRNIIVAPMKFIDGNDTISNESQVISYLELTKFYNLSKSNNITVAAMEFSDGNGTIMNGSQVISYLVQTQIYKDGTNVFGLIIFCFVFGVIAGQLGEFGAPVVNFFIIVNEIIMRIVILIMWYSPVGIMSLIIGQIMTIYDLAKAAEQLGLYMLTVITGLAIHGCVTLPLIYFLSTRKNPLPFFKGMLPAWVTALGTASSAATLPVTFRCLEENNRIDATVTRFVLSLGTIVNMDGAALYEAVAAIFIAHTRGMYLSAGQVIAVSLAATVASIGAARVPRTGFITILLVLTAVGLPTEDISMIVAVDWLLYRVRTSINVLSDAYGAGIIHHLCHGELEHVDAEGVQLEMQEVCTVPRRQSSMTSRRSSGHVDNDSGRAKCCASSSSQPTFEEGGIETEI